MKTTKPTPAAHKMLQIMCGMFNFNYNYFVERINPQTSLQKFNIVGSKKVKLLTRLAIHFNTKLCKAQVNAVNTVWDMLKFCEGHNDLYFLNPQNCIGQFKNKLMPAPNQYEFIHLSK